MHVAHGRHVDIKNCVLYARTRVNVYEYMVQHNAAPQRRSAMPESDADGGMHFKISLAHSELARGLARLRLSDCCLWVLCVTKRDHNEISQYICMHAYVHLNVLVLV